MKWYDVNEKMPREYTRVLTRESYGRIRIGYWRDQKVITDGIRGNKDNFGFLWRCEGQPWESEIPFRLTHWARIPKCKIKIDLDPLSPPVEFGPYEAIRPQTNDIQEYMETKGNS